MQGGVATEASEAEAAAAAAKAAAEAAAAAAETTEAAKALQAQAQFAFLDWGVARGVKPQRVSLSHEHPLNYPSQGVEHVSVRDHESSTIPKMTHGGRPLRQTL